MVLKNMTLLRLISIVILSYACFADGQTCTRPDGSTGQCISIYECSSILELLPNPKPSQVKLLRSSFCKFVNKTPWVCCPSEPCETPEGVQGKCVEIQTCPHLAKILQLSPSQEAIDYVEKSRCGNSDQQNVCCDFESVSSPKLSLEERNGNQCQLTAFPPEPDSECCGVEAVGDEDRIVGGDATALTEYPWLALIEYVKDTETRILCGGVLISGRYVLTAGHCIVGIVLLFGTPTNVRLGEYDTSNPGADCIEVESRGRECNDGAVVIPIQKTIPHEEYDAESKLNRNDIALIRLDRIVEYTDFIRPICLPTSDFTTTPASDLTLYAAGWGAVSDVQSSSNIKQKVELPYMPLQDCQPGYNVTNRKAQLWEGQVCAGGDIGRDSCRGDSGGPLMRQNRWFFELVGIVSFGTVPCGVENVAGVYSRVFYYLPWIKSNIVA